MGVEVLDWPTKSPDLNPIEHLWQHLKRQLAKYENDPVSIYELWERVETEWNNIPQICLDLITTMPRRVDCRANIPGRAYGIRALRFSPFQSEPSVIPTSN